MTNTKWWTDQVRSSVIIFFLKDNSRFKCENANALLAGEVHDVRTRNRGLKILILVLIALVVLAGVAAAVYFFVFADDGKVHLEFEPLPEKNSLIYLNQTDAATGEEWSKKLDNFIQGMKTQITLAG